ncbi:transporter substrate-binding domain-containing protein [Neobacillus vireti]|uniref:Glutamine ABC transporter glutamine-binding protein GlnH n=1 Tax=Neobacillus vireti LMG 21834 TaxID=1131730 RepID=A0AB94IT01_9BACI|nr:transporter substrate-binding domain-containing protein [Neobacillus vireti]ETI70211.1 glutamine ABC transporter glutamine-binding protein GlnH [Neobacillus vireti LMG 21834]KLT16425.1 amino acid ABC transporter substrate-binding protein [Neobacillus vireti]
MFKSKTSKIAGVLLLSASMLLSACGKGGDKETSGSAKNALEQIKSKDKIVIGVKYDTRLFGLKNPSTGEVEGFDIDISKELAKDLVGDAKKVEFKEVTSKTRIPMLNNGDIDAIVATMTISEERKKEADFSDVYFDAGQSLLVKKGSPIKGLEDLKKGTKVLAVKGSTSAINISQKAPDTTVLEFENYTEAFTALKAGKGDALTTDDSILYGMVDQDSNYELVGGTFTDEPYGIAVKKGNEELVDAINSALKKMKENGKYDEIHKKWIRSN